MADRQGSGLGLIPPTDEEDDDQPQGTDPGDDTKPGSSPPANEEEDDDIDGPPPVGEADDDDEDEDDDEDDGQFDAERFRTQMLDEVQRRFDRAVSKAVRNLESRLGVEEPPAGSDDDDDDDDEAPPPPSGGDRRKKRRAASGVDVRTIRVLARDRIQDEMEKFGSTERKAAKAIVDQILPHVDWSSTDDDEFVGQLVSLVAEQSQALVKAGSDRKIAQLRKMGHLPQRDAQPGGQPGAAGPGANHPETVMSKGARRAKQRWPEGKRRLGG